MRVALLVAGAACALAACSVVLSPDDHTGGGGSVSAPELCDAIVLAYCEAHESCCAPESTLDRADCLDATRPICDALVDIASDTRTAYDPEAGAALLTRAQGLLESCDPEVLDALLGSEGLVSTLEGTVVPGDTCSTRTAPDLAEFFSCRLEHACVRVGSSRWSCLARVPEGGSCRVDGDCEEGLFCDSGILGIVDGTCVARRAVNEPCGRASECESLLCSSSACQPLTVESVYCVLSE